MLTFALVSAGWVFFRAVLSFMLGAAEEYGGVIAGLAKTPVWVRTAIAVAVLLAIELFTASETAVPFVYFQF